MKAIKIRIMALEWCCERRMKFGCMSAMLIWIEIPVRDFLGPVRVPLEAEILDEASE